MAATTRLCKRVVNNTIIAMNLNDIMNSTLIAASEQSNFWVTFTKLGVPEDHTFMHFNRLVTILPVRGQAANRRTGRSEFEFRGRVLSWRHVMKLTNQVLSFDNSIILNYHIRSHLRCIIIFFSCSRHNSISISTSHGTMLDPWVP